MSTPSPSHALTLEIPASIYESLVKIAAQTGQQPEEFAIQWLTITLQQCQDDPIEAFIGAFNSQNSDWSDRHDAYLRQSVAASTEIS